MKLAAPRLPHDRTIELTTNSVQVADPQIDEAAGLCIASVL